MILAADLSTRAGRVLSPPWFTGADQQLQTDLCSDWVEPISFILENDGLDNESALGIVSLGTCQNDNVIDFPISDLDQELTGSES